MSKKLFDVALMNLKKCESLCENNKYAMSVVYNNFACYYRNIKQLRTAYKYIEKTLSLENELNKPFGKAETHLNACAILSEMKIH